MSAGGKEYSFALRIKGFIDRTFNTSFAIAENKLKALKKTVNKMDRDFNRLDGTFDGIMNAGKRCFSAVATAAGVAGGAIAAATAAAVTTGSEFESAFAGVKKTVDATEEQYNSLRESILKMTRTIPSSASEIAEVMEMAGQLGIKTDSLTEFTETMINLGVATNLSADEAASALAKFANVTSMKDYGADGISNWSRLGSTIVDLGNNFATTEADIVNMATRLASTGSLVGLSEQQIMALSTAMSSVGIEAEAGGSAMSKMLRKVQTSVETGDKNLKKYASVAGMSVKKFKDAFKKDALSALTAFIAGLKDTKRNGKSAIVMLSEMGLKEERLTNAVMSLSNASEMMNDAVNTANKAWNENTALANEAEQKYKTLESKVQLMKNGLKELGIAAYDEMRDPIASAVDTVAQKFQGLTDYAKSAGGLKKWMRELKVEIPTFLRKFKNIGSTAKNISPALRVLMFAIKPFLAAAQWFVKHPKAIVSTLVGIGTALTVHKIASKFIDIGKAILSLSTGQKILSGVSAGIALVSAGLAAYAQHEQEAIDNNIADHFGTVKLSMEELEQAAAHIVNSESLTKVTEALENYGKLSELSAEMESAVADINKMNWKVSIGMTLTPDEQESYKESIANYVTNAQKFAEQTQYSVSVSLALGLDPNDEEGKTIVDKVNQFYQNESTQLAELGAKLNQTVTDAFNDGFLDIEEAETISKLQKQMAEIEEKIATDDMESTLAALDVEYGGVNLDGESFQNLEEEVTKQAEAANEKYRQVYVKNMSAYKNTYEAGQLTKEEYENSVKAEEKKYKDKLVQSSGAGLSYMLNKIMEQYGFNEDAVLGEMQKTLSKYAGDDMKDEWSTNPEKTYNQMKQELSKGYENALGEDNVKAAKQLRENMQGVADELSAAAAWYKENGYELPDDLSQDLNQYELLRRATGGLFDWADFDEMWGRLDWSGFSDSAKEAVQGVIDDAESLNKEYKKEEQRWGDKERYQGLQNVQQNIAATARETMNYMDGSKENEKRSQQAQKKTEWQGSNMGTLGTFDMSGFSSAQTAITTSVFNAAKAAREEAEKVIDSTMGKDYKTEAKVKLSLKPEVQFPKIQLPDLTGSAVKIYKNAKGGIWNHPILTTFAENGPEAAIPLDGSRNAVSLWKRAGQLLGMESEGSRLSGVSLEGGGSPPIEYKPTLQFYGGAPNREDLEGALKMSQDEFDRMMNRYLKNNSRLSFT